MIAKVARSVRKRAARLLGAQPRPEDLLRRKTIARSYLRGSGLEIGALHNPLKVPPGARVRYVDRLSAADLRREYPELAKQDLVRVDILDDGETLANVGDATQDFVIANHFLEHCENPIGAVGNMLRVLKPGGILYLAIPDKRYTFDVDRPVTPIEHLMRDFEEGPDWSRRSHYEEWTRLVKKVSDRARAEREVETLMSTRASIHFHVWTQAEILDLISVLGRRWGVDVELMFKRDNEVLFILRKPAPDPRESGHD
jgi:SAM-dependent methyltransferase